MSWLTIGMIVAVAILMINAGVYWDPVSQLTLGLQGDYTSTSPLGDGDDVHAWSAKFGTWFRF